jgi:hypothetical protein
MQPRSQHNPLPVATTGEGDARTMGTQTNANSEIVQNSTTTAGPPRAATHDISSSDSECVEASWPPVVDNDAEMRANFGSSSLPVACWNEDTIPWASEEEQRGLQEAHAIDHAQVSLAREVHRALHPELEQFSIGQDTSSEEDVCLLDPFQDLTGFWDEGTADTQQPVPAGGPPELEPRHNSGESSRGDAAPSSSGGPMLIPTPSQFGLPDFP